MRDTSPDTLTVILQLCECYEEIGDESELSAGEMARVIRAVQNGGEAAIMDGGRVASAVSGRFPPGHPLWLHVKLLS